MVYVSKWIPQCCHNFRTIPVKKKKYRKAPCMYIFIFILFRFVFVILLLSVTCQILCYLTDFVVLCSHSYLRVIFLQTELKLKLVSFTVMHHLRDPQVTGLMFWYCVCSFNRKLKYKFIDFMALYFCLEYFSKFRYFVFSNILGFARELVWNWRSS